MIMYKLHGWQNYSSITQELWDKWWLIKVFHILPELTKWDNFMHSNHSLMKKKNSVNFMLLNLEQIIISKDKILMRLDVLFILRKCKALSRFTVILLKKTALQKFSISRIFFVFTIFLSQMFLNIFFLTMQDLRVTTFK